MLCSQCGHTNLDDANFCSACGKSVERIAADSITAEGVACASCGCVNEEHVSFCRSCGQKIAMVVTANMVSVAGDSSDIPASGTPAPDLPESQDSSGSAAVSTRHESFVAKLDQMEVELKTKQSVPLTEPSVMELDEENQAKLDSLSSTLDALIADLLEVEISEYAYPDFIHPDESGFPSMEASSYEKKETPEPATVKKRSVHELILIIGALIIAIFFVGLSFGLWGAYFMGL
ncbi:MAG: zinc ribbon domain-containing protein [Synergistaceae bacterium]|nr:zinc ribbon domain-containing protein [Synergistaceae bacterium]